MKRILVLLLCALAVFAIVSCKNDPKPEPTPEYKVTFDTCGGSEIAPVTVKKGDIVEKPTDPIKLGSLGFAGWYTDAEYKNAYNFETPVTGAFTLYAQWDTGMYRITSTKFTSSDGNSDDKFVITWKTDDNVKAKAGDVLSITFRTTEPFTQYSIRGDKKWFHEKDSSNPYPQFFSTFEVGTDGWTTVTYVFPPEDAATQEKISYGENGTWFMVYFRNQKMVPGAFMEVRDVKLNDVKLRLDASHIDTYTAPTFEIVAESYEWKDQTVKFDTDGGTAVADQTVEFGKRAARPESVPVKIGVMFVDWYADAELTEVFDFKNTPITKETTVYARYGVPVLVTFDTQGGSAINPAVVAAGTPVDKPEDPTKEGKYFYGWYTDAACTNAYDFETEVTESMMLYARWVDPATLTFNYNYEGSESKSVTVGKGLSVETPEQLGRSGYFFGGWYKEAACTTEFDASKGIEEDTTIYAKWVTPTKLYEYTATQSSDRFQWRFKGSSVALLSSIQPGDVITFQAKFTTATVNPYKYRVRTYDGEKEVSGGKVAFSDPVDGWYSVTVVAPATGDFIGKNGLYVQLFADDDWEVGDICEFKALAYNGIEIPISTTSTSSGAYEGVYPTVVVKDI